MSVAWEASGSSIFVYLMYFLFTDYLDMSGTILDAVYTEGTKQNPYTHGTCNTATFNMQIIYEMYITCI